MTTVGEWFQLAITRLNTSNVFDDDAQLTLKFLVENRVKRASSFLSDAVLEKSELIQLDHDLQLLIAGNPLPYVIGEWSFYGLDFIVSPDVLIPRPETELLVEKALLWLSKKADPTIYDIGTGSGIIAITLAKHHPSAQIIASDISIQALEICRKNIDLHKVGDKITVTNADGIPDSEDKINLLCANLPYIPEVVVDGLKVTNFEPRIALDGGPDGLRIVERVLAKSVNRMKPNSLLLFEIESSQGLVAQNLADKYYPHSTISILKDFSEKDRILRIETA